MFDMFDNGGVASSAPQVLQGDIFVVSVGGSLLFSENGPDAAKIKAIADAISQLHYSGKKIAVVVGGGKSARSYVEAARASGLNNFEQDLLGISLTRANAALLAAAMPNAFRDVLTDITRSRDIIDNGKIPVFGGLMPLFTTDTVAALLAEFLGATFVNLTNVDGIYDSNPKENPNAQKFPEISYSRLVELISFANSEPGQNLVLDLPCCLVLKRSKVPAFVLDGNDLANFSAFVRGEQFSGTAVREIYGEESEAEEDSAEPEPKKKPRKKAQKKKPAKQPGRNPGPINPYQIDF